VVRCSDSRSRRARSIPCLAAEIQEDRVGRLRQTAVRRAGARPEVPRPLYASRLEPPATPEIYYSFAQSAAATSDAGVSLVIRVGMRPGALGAAVRDAVHQANPNQVLFNVETMIRVIAESFAGANLYLSGAKV
jgi:hypothetical protein